MKVFAIIFLFAIVSVAVSATVIENILPDKTADPTIKNAAKDGADGSNWTITGLSNDFEREHLQAVVKHLEKNLGVHINDNDDLEKVLEDAFKASHKTVDRFLDDLTAGADEQLKAVA